MIILTRVDHRLIHGQVAFSWTNTIGANCILVANDEVASDPIQMSTLRLAAPQGVKVVIKNIKDSIEAINSGVTDKYKLFIVIKNVTDAFKLIENTTAIHELNLGGTLETKNSKQITPAVFLSLDDESKLKKLISDNISVYSQIVPTEQKIMLETKL